MMYAMFRYRTRSPRIESSFFAGPTAFYRGQERRRWWRRLTAISRLGHTEPTEFLIAITMLQGALVLLLQEGPGTLPFPTFFGWLMLMGGLTGLIGLASRVIEIRLAFAFGSIALRLWMTSLCLMRNWHDPAWCAYATGAIAMAWVLVRLMCIRQVRKLRANSSEES